MAIKIGITKFNEKTMRKQNQRGNPNGVYPLGVAFDGVRNLDPNFGYFPAISLSQGERCDLNFGSIISIA